MIFQLLEIQFRLQNLSHTSYGSIFLLLIVELYFYENYLFSACKSLRGNLFYKILLLWPVCLPFDSLCILKYFVCVMQCFFWISYEINSSDWVIKNNHLMFLNQSNQVIHFFYIILEWGEWKNNRSCSVTCGQGSLTVSRECLDYNDHPTNNITKCFTSDDNEDMMLDTKTIQCSFNFSCTGLSLSYFFLHFNKMDSAFSIINLTSI